MIHNAPAFAAAGTLLQEDSAPAILLSNVCKRFGAFDALKSCSLTIPRGSFVSLLGPSGCGKTTLLRMIGGFERQTSGSISVQGHLVDGLPPNKRDVNTVFQRYALFPHKTVAENVAFPLELKEIPKAERGRRVSEMLALVHLEGLEMRRPAQLSGGQAQRVALARALAADPAVLLLDEPLAALDLKLRKAMQLELRRIQMEIGTTFLYVTHDQEEALTMSDSIVLMERGEIVQQGTPMEIYDQPRTKFASQFIGEANLLQGKVSERREGAIVVATSGISVLASTTEGPGVGYNAILSIRPEQLAIEAVNGAKRPCATNSCRGVVRRRIFMGHIIRMTVEISPDLTLTVEHGSARKEQFDEGTPVIVSWTADAKIGRAHV